MGSNGIPSQCSLLGAVVADAHQKKAANAATIPGLLQMGIDYDLLQRINHSGEITRETVAL
jgi:hypothetical protein